MKCCPSCGQPLLPISGLGLSPTQWRIYEALKKHPGLTFEQLRSVIFRDREDGGPETRQAVHGQIDRMNKRLAARGLRVRHEGGSWGVHAPRWFITRLAQEAAG